MQIHPFPDYPTAGIRLARSVWSLASIFALGYTDWMAALRYDAIEDEI